MKEMLKCAFTAPVKPRMSSSCHTLPGLSQAPRRLSVASLQRTAALQILQTACNRRQLCLLDAELLQALATACASVTVTSSVLVGERVRKTGTVHCRIR